MLSVGWPTLIRKPGDAFARPFDTGIGAKNGKSIMSNQDVTIFNAADPRYPRPSTSSSLTPAQ
jgi:hypothetical protein